MYPLVARSGLFGLAVKNNPLRVFGYLFQVALSFHLWPLSRSQVLSPAADSQSSFLKAPRSASATIHRLGLLFILGRCGNSQALCFDCTGAS